MSIYVNISVYMYIYIYIYIYIYTHRQTERQTERKREKKKDTDSMLNTEQWKVHILGKVEQSRERGSPLSYTLV